MMPKVSLGANTITYVDSPEKCPPGTRAEMNWDKVAYSVMGPLGPAAAIAENSEILTSPYRCVAGEPWHCEWFGIGCRGPEIAAPGAPGTETQMRVPGAWTPEMSAEQQYKNQQKYIQMWAENTSGAAMAQSAANDAGDKLKASVPWVVLALIFGAIVLIKAR